MGNMDSVTIFTQMVDFQQSRSTTSANRSSTQMIKKFVSKWNLRLRCSWTSWEISGKADTNNNGQATKTTQIMSQCTIQLARLSQIATRQDRACGTTNKSLTSLQIFPSCAVFVVMCSLQTACQQPVQTSPK